MQSENKKFLLPSPVFTEVENYKNRLVPPHFMSPEGMLMPGKMQPPPMYGPRGSTIPPKYFKDYGKGYSQQFATMGFEEFVCETCDRSFRSGFELEGHKTEHQKCEIDGCTFVGHAKAIERHIEQQHATGLYESIKKLNTPEEIEKWRDQRRKRYPTRANVELRQKLQQEKFKRGEKLSKPKNRFGKMQDRERIMKNTKRPLKIDRKRHANEDNKKMEAVQEKQKRSQEASCENSSDILGLIKFTGTTHLQDYERQKPKVKQNALTSLLGMYGSDDDSDEEEEENESGRDSSVSVVESTFNECTEPGRFDRSQLQKFCDTNAPKANTILSAGKSSEELNDGYPEEFPSIKKVEILQGAGNIHEEKGERGKSTATKVLKSGEATEIGGEIPFTNNLEQDMASKYEEQDLNDTSIQTQTISKTPQLMNISEKSNENGSEEEPFSKKVEEIAYQDKILVENQKWSKNNNFINAAEELLSAKEFETNCEEISCIHKKQDKVDNSNQSQNTLRIEKPSQAPDKLNEPDTKILEKICKHVELGTTEARDQDEDVLKIHKSIAALEESRGHALEKVTCTKTEQTICKEIARPEKTEPQDQVDISDQNYNVLKADNSIEFSEESSGEAPEEVPFTKKVEDITEGNLDPKIATEPHKKRIRTRRKPHNEKPKNVTKTSTLDYTKLRKYKQNTMLEKLLMPEIIHERNVILQCVRFVVENNFFNIGTEKS